MSKFAKYKALIVFGLEGIPVQIEVGEVIILPEIFGDELVEKGSVEKIAE